MSRLEAVTRDAQTVGAAACVVRKARYSMMRPMCACFLYFTGINAAFKKRNAHRLVLSLG